MAIKTLFLNPPFHPRFSREQRSPAVTKSDTFYYPKWLCHAAGVAIKEGYNVDIIDAPAAKVSVDYVIDRMQNKGIQALICDTSTPSINNDIQVVDTIKNKLPDVKVLMVGRHVSVLPEHTLSKSNNIDAIALREYEYTVRDWLAAINSGASLEGVDGLVWKNTKGETIKNKEREAIKNLDELPFVTEVYKRFLHIPNYFYAHSKHPIVVFDSSRGCPYKCSFCVYPQTFSGHKMRYRSVGHVADEFEFVAKEMPEVKAIMLEDDTFIINKNRTLELAEELIQRSNKLPFDSNCRADIGGEVELLKKLHQAGARLFCVGFESGDTNVISHMHKHLKASQNEYYLDTAQTFTKACKKAGIMVHGCFMIGNLNETQESMEATLKFAKQINPDTAQFFPIMVYPGTAAYEEAKQKGYLATENFDAWLTADGLHNSVVNLPNLTHRELVEFADRARREFYLRPSYIWHKTKQSLRDFDEFKRNIHGFAALSKYLIKGSFSKEQKS